MQSKGGFDGAHDVPSKVTPQGPVVVSSFLWLTLFRYSHHFWLNTHTLIQLTNSVFHVRSLNMYYVVVMDYLVPQPLLWQLGCFQHIYSMGCS